MSTVKRGTIQGGIEYQGFTYNKSPDRPGTTNKSWKGDLPSIAQQSDVLSLYGWTVNIEREDGDIYVLRASYQGKAFDDDDDAGTPEVPPPDINTDPVTNWEIRTVAVQRPILESDTPLTEYINVLGADAINRSLKEGNDKAVFTYVNSASDAGVSAEVYGTVVETYYHILKGVKTYEEPVPVIIKKMSFTQQSTLADHQTGVGTLYTTQKVVADNQIPNQLHPLLPFLSQYYVVPDSPGVLDVPTSYGWKKGPPQVTQINSTTFQLTQQWVWGKWATRVYGVVQG